MVVAVIRCPTFHGSRDRNRRYPKCCPVLDCCISRFSRFQPESNPISLDSLLNLTQFDSLLNLTTGFILKSLSSVQTQGLPHSPCCHPWISENRIMLTWEWDNAIGNLTITAGKKLWCVPIVAIGFNTKFEEYFFFLKKALEAFGDCVYVFFFLKNNFSIFKQMLQVTSYKQK